MPAQWISPIQNPILVLKRTICEISRIKIPHLTAHHFIVMVSLTWLHTHYRKAYHHWPPPFIIYTAASPLMVSHRHLFLLYFYLNLWS